MTTDARLSPLDEMRFGVRTVKAEPQDEADLASVVAFAEQERAKLVIVRVPTSALTTVQTAEAQGFRLMDTLVYYAHGMTALPLRPDVPDVRLRPASIDDTEAVTQIARAAFQGYMGHYHADPRLPDDDCDAVYIDWARRSLDDPAVATAVHVAVDNLGGVLGFITLRRLDDAQGDGPLYGVAPEAQGRRIGRLLMWSGLNWCHQQGLMTMVMSTQITNVQSQKVWARLGFEFCGAEYTLHKWFDD